ncbi:hypothetical protein EDB19DRAFT_1878260 [Suillus lakei]|nr:hypothetical protein EDB19DRAFT_1878260 [Suillus lakei]
MHICLVPTEILLDIFTTIYEGPRRRSSRTTLAVLARTCRTFKEPALDTLWKHLKGFKPLISCLPQCVSNRNMQGQLTLNRPLFTGEWRIFGQYAQRIRSLYIGPAELDIIDDRVIQALISASLPLPNLRTLRWSDDRECFLPLLRTLLGSTITSMKLDSIFTPSFAKSALLASLRVRCPSIRELSCVYSGDSEESSDSICEAVYGLRELVYLRTGVLNTHALLHLASLPSLKSLHFRTYGPDDIQPNSPPTFAYQLNDVSITAPSLFVLTQRLRNIRFPSCRSATLIINADDMVPPLDIPDFIVSISECFFPGLERFLVDFGEGQSEGFTDLLFALSFDAVAPLLSLSRLTELDLSWFCASAIDDASLKRMAQSWPQLEKFYFGTRSRWLAPSSLTFIGLVYLIQHCPHLQFVQIPFYARPVDTKSEPFSKLIPNKNITDLHVGVSPIVDPLHVACQLHILLPNLTTVSRGDISPLLLTFELEHSEDGWDKVNEFLKALTTAATMREEMGQASQERSSPA